MSMAEAERICFVRGYLAKHTNCFGTSLITRFVAQRQASREAESTKCEKIEFPFKIWLETVCPAKL